MRQGHWLRGNARTMIPESHVLIATTLTEKSDEVGVGALNLCDVRLAHWHDTGLLLQQQECLTRQQCAWQTIRPFLDKKHATIIWLDCPRENLPALNFTGLVEEEDFARKYWVWGDAPVIISGKLFGCRVKILGIQNWVADYSPPDGTSFDRGCHLYNAVETVLRFVHREDLGHLRSTIASQAFQAYRHLALPGKIGIHCNRPALNLERTLPLGHPVRQFAYGRVKGPVYVLDVNGMYPYVMGNYPYPRKLLWHTETITVEELKRATVNELVIARVSGGFSEAEVLVHRPGGAVFTRHLDHDVLCGPDLDRVLYSNSLCQVSEACAYDGAGVFAQWSDWAHALRDKYRKSGTITDYAIAKGLTTMLWSQFAHRLARWTSYDEGPPAPKDYGEFYHHTVDGEVVLCRAIAGVIDRLETLEETDDSFPAISGFVSAYARDYMRRLCGLAGWANVLYVVADAIHVTFEGYAKLMEFGIIHPTRPGALKVKQEVKEACYLAANVNILDGVLTQAGRPCHAKEGPKGTWTWYSVNSLRSEILRAPDGAVHSEWHHATTPDPAMVSGEKYLPD